MQRALIALMLAAAMLPFGCGAAGYDMMGPAMTTSEAKAVDSERYAAGAEGRNSDAPMAPPETGEPKATASVEPRKVIYTARLEIIVADVESALARTDEIARKMGGYMQHVSGSGITIRVPADKFDSAVAEVTKLGPVAERNITAQDVTEQYTDLKVRLDNARATLKRLQAILEKTTTVKDVLAVEQELARVRTEIERMQGQMNLLSSRIAYATITVAFRRSSDVPQHIRVRLPFWWLGQLGLETLMDF